MGRYCKSLDPTDSKICKECLVHAIMVKKKCILKEDSFCEDYDLFGR